MEYTVKRLSQMAGVSARTLRYYDQIGLLPPARISSSGYRIYGAQQVDRLQQILFYRELGVSLEEIGNILSTPGYDAVKALEAQHEQLLGQQARLSLLIRNIEKTINARKGGITMSDKEKFEGFKRSMIEENEQTYGAEIRQKYGDKTIDESNTKLMGLSAEQYAQMQEKAQEILSRLEAAVKQGLSPHSQEGREIAALHKDWLGYTWSQYSPQAHAGLTLMYVQDERFTAYYDKEVSGCAAFLRQCILSWLGLQE